MRKTILAILSLVAMTSCEQAPEDLLVGRWELTKLAITADGLNIESSAAEADVAMTYTFKADGSYSLLAIYAGEEESEMGAYVYDETSQAIICSYDDYTYSTDVTSISKTELVLTLSIEGLISSTMYFVRK